MVSLNYLLQQMPDGGSFRATPGTDNSQVEFQGLVQTLTGGTTELSETQSSLLNEATHWLSKLKTTLNLVYNRGFFSKDDVIISQETFHVLANFDDGKGTAFLEQLQQALAQLVHQLGANSRGQKTDALDPILSFLDSIYNIEVALKNSVASNLQQTSRNVESNFTKVVSKPLHYLEMLDVFRVDKSASEPAVQISIYSFFQVLANHLSLLVEGEANRRLNSNQTVVLMQAQLLGGSDDLSSASRIPTHQTNTLALADQSSPPPEDGSMDYRSWQMFASEDSSISTSEFDLAEEILSTQNAKMGSGIEKPQTGVLTQFPRLDMKNQDRSGIQSYPISTSLTGIKKTSELSGIQPQTVWLSSNQPEFGTIPAPSFPSALSNSGDEFLQPPAQSTFFHPIESLTRVDPKFLKQGIVNTPKFALSIASQIRFSEIRDGITRVELRPGVLGSIEIEMATDTDGVVNVVIRAENLTVLSALREMRETLAQMLPMGQNGDVSFEDKSSRRDNGDDAIHRSADEADSETPRDPQTQINHNASKTVIRGSQLDIVT